MTRSTIRSFRTILSNSFVQSVEFFGGCAVEIEPPVTDKVLLIEDCAIGTQEGIQLEVYTSFLTDVEDLAASFISSVSIVSWSGAFESSVGDFR